MSCCCGDETTICGERVAARLMKLESLKKSILWGDEIIIPEGRIVELNVG